MNDRGEKIINLAREMLRAELPASVAETHDDKRARFTFKALCMTVLLATFCGGAATHVIDEMRRPVNRYERVELEALLFYASRVKSLDEEGLRQEVLGKFALASLDDLSAAEFHSARDYLQSRIR